MRENKTEAREKERGEMRKEIMSFYSEGKVSVWLICGLRERERENV